MARLTLLSQIGVEQADETAQRSVDLFEQRFPGRVRGYYLVGSYAVGEAIATSDVDIVALFKGAPSDAEREHFGYPDADGEFFGYDQRRMRLADGTTVASTKNVVLNVLGAANALTLQATGQYLGSGKKSEIAAHYRAWVGGEWAGPVAELYEFGRNRWAYRVPEQPGERRHLRELCAQALGFENYFLERYREFLLAERESGDAARREIAERRLGQLFNLHALRGEEFHSR
jgi:hypothetical protein